MKKLIVSLFVAGIAWPMLAQDFTAPYTARRDLDEVRKVPPSEGALQTGVRQGNPAQLLNPVAPPEYGSGQQHVAYDQNDPYLQSHRPRAMGIRLFALAW